MSARGSVTPERLVLAEQVRRLRDDDGLGYREISQRLAISRTYAQSLYSDADGSKARARKDGYRGVCVDCGDGTSGSNGRAAAPERCSPCAHALEHAERKWTREAVIDAIQRFNLANGRPPLSDEWVRADPENGYPARASVYQSRTGDVWQPFLKWSDAIEAAGFPRPLVGRYVRRPRGTVSRGRQVYTSEGRKPVRDYIVLELDDDGRWIEHPVVQSYSEALAIEKLVETLGNLNGRASHRFVAVSRSRWIVRELQTVTSLKAIVTEPTA